MRKLCFIGITILLLSACGIEPLIGDYNESHQDPFYERVSNKNDVLIEGEMTDIADLNPNFLDTNPAEKGVTNNQGVYEDKLVAEVKRSEKFSPRYVTFFGSKATVHVTANGSYSKADVKKLQDKLQSVVPRFDIRVDVD